MPARAVYDDPQAELAQLRKREDDRRRQARDGMRRLRAERKAARLTPPEAVNGTAVTLTGASKNGRLAHPPQTPPSLLSLYEREREEIVRALEPLAPRGYVHSERFWEVAREQYPLLCLELEALKLADWLQEPRNSKRRCSKAFLDNWLKKAEADRLIRDATQAAGTTSAHYGPRNGAGGNGVYHQPQSQQHNRQPDAPRLLEGELVPISRVDFERYKAERRAIPLEQRTAQLKGGKP